MPVADIPLLERIGGAGACVGLIALGVMPLVLDRGTRFTLVLWGMSLLLAFWTHRMWRCAADGRIAIDPVSFALHDRGSHWLGAAALLGLLAIA